MVWTDEVVSLTRDMWAQGYTATQAAAEVEREHGQALSKNQIICKMWRVGVRHGERPKEKPEPKVPAPAPPPARPRRRPAPVVAKAPVWRPAPAKAPEGVLLREARFGECRWIEGEPTADAVCCEHPTIMGKSWCKRHARIVLVRARSRLL